MMVSYLQKYLTKAILFLSFTALSIVVAATIAFNIILARSKNTIIQAADKYFTQKLSIENAIYLPPDFIVIRNASVQEAAVPALWLRFSLPELIARRRVSISTVYFYRPRMNYSKFSRLLRDNFQQIIEFIKHLPKQDIKISIKEAELGLEQKGKSADYIAANFFLKIKGNSVSVSGSMSKDSYGPFLKSGNGIKRPVRGLPLRCIFKGAIIKDGVSIENLEFMREDLYSKLLGSYTGDVFRLSGFALMNTLLKGRGHQEAAPRRAGRFRAIDLSKVNLYVLDIDCQINLIFPRIQIERLNFALNNNPISLKGGILFSEPVSLDLELSSDQRQSEKAHTENLKRIDLRIKGVLGNNAFNGNGMLNLDFIKKKKANPPLERLKLDFKELTLHFAEYPRIKMSLEELILFCLTESNTYRVFLNDFNALIHLQNEKSKFIEFNSLFYDGSLKGWGRLDLDGLPARISSVIRLRDVNANKLDGLLIHFSKVYGRLFGQVYFSSYPHLGLNGGMVMEKGYLRDFEFFKWLADFFNLPSLKRIDFAKASSNFTVDAEGASLHEIKLGSKDVNLSGHFKLGADDLVSSKLSLILSRELLKESPKFRPLLKLADPELNALNFNFQLSGILHAMNFKWLSSDFKKEAQDAIPNFIERKIEKDVEDIIESVQIPP